MLKHEKGHFRFREIWLWLWRFREKCEIDYFLSTWGYPRPYCSASYLKFMYIRLCIVLNSALHEKCSINIQQILHLLDKWLRFLANISYLLFSILFDLYIYAPYLSPHCHLVEFPDGVSLIHVFNTLCSTRMHVSNVFSLWKIWNRGEKWIWDDLSKAKWLWPYAITIFPVCFRLVIVHCLHWLRNWPRKGRWKSLPIIR